MRGWDISRTRPNGRHAGRALPIFINNWLHHLTTLNVFDDGAVDCWGFVDLALFDQKLRSGWVALQPPVSAQLSIHNLGSSTVVEARWDQDSAKLRGDVHEIVKTLNPSGSGLVDMKGTDTELRGKVRYAKMALGDARPVRRGSAGEEIPGKALPVFVRHEEGWRLDNWFVFADGTARFGPDGEILSFGASRERLGDDVRTSVPDGTWVELPELGAFRVGDGNWYVEPAERGREAVDELAQLRGEPGAIACCMKAFAAYEADRSPERVTSLRAAYESVPEHLRLYCGDMDTKDSAIRAVLYGSEDPEGEPA